MFASGWAGESANSVRSVAGRKRICLYIRVLGVRSFQMLNEARKSRVCGHWRFLR
jgi:hypothetical protein